MTTPTDDDARAAQDDDEKARDWMPTPPAMAVAVLAMLGFGVMLGSATSQIAQSAGAHSIILEVASPAPAPAEEPVVESSGAAATEAAAPAALPAEVPALPAPLPVAPEAPAEEAKPPTLPPEIPDEETLPPVKHVFLIVLGEDSYEDSFGATSPVPYLAKTLAETGELLSNYYAVTQGQLANEIALLSGQGPTPETAADCPVYADLLPGTVSVEGQVEGSGCVYPAATPTLPGQLVEKKLKWKAYVEDLAQPCVHVDGQRNPFVYFHGIVDKPECASADVGLDQLPLDLKDAKKTPALSYIVPHLCDGGGEAICPEGQPSGPLATEEFLKRAVPAIEASPAYKEGGLIAITSAQAPQSGEKADASSCCIAPKYPNLPEPPAEPTPATGPVKPTGGGGRVGLLLISPFVTPGSVNESGYYNHYALLRSVEELFELEPLGYAAEIALTAFDGTVYSYEASSSSASCRDCASRVPSADHSWPSSSKKPSRATPDSKASR